MILPPFPFVEQWDSVRKQNGIAHGRQWSVPGLPLRMGSATGTNSEQFQVEQTLGIPQFSSDQPDASSFNRIDDEAEFELQLNPEWAARFARTNSRRRERLHKKELQTVLTQDHHTFHGFGNYPSDSMKSKRKARQGTLVKPTRAQRLEYEAKIVESEQKALQAEKQGISDLEQVRRNVFAKQENYDTICALEARLNSKFDPAIDQKKSYWWPETS